MRHILRRFVDTYTNYETDRTDFHFSYIVDEEFTYGEFIPLLVTISVELPYINNSRSVKDTRYKVSKEYDGKKKTWSVDWEIDNVKKKDLHLIAKIRKRFEKQLVR